MWNTRVSAFDLVVLALACYRLFVLVSEDKITAYWRQRLLGYNDADEQGVSRRNHWRKGKPGRKKTGEFIHCPWCLGFWLSLAAWLAYQAWPHGAIVVLAPFALSSLVAVISVAFHHVILDEG